MADSREVLSWVALTAMVDETKMPHRFVRDLVFQSRSNEPTEVIEIGVLIGDRVVGPFVKRGASGIEVTGYSEKFYNVTAPNIRIKRHLEPSELMFQRRVGLPIMADKQVVVTGAEQQSARSTRRLLQVFEEAEEYLCCQALRGQIVYQVDEEEAMQITFPRSGSHAITLTTFWDQAGGKPSNDCTTALDLVSVDSGLNITHCILGSEATNAFLDNAQVQALLDNRRMEAGLIQLQSPFNQTGAMRLGNFRGIEFWSYPRKTQVPSAPGMGSLTSFDLIRPKYAEFVVADPAAENHLYYGAIPDIDALDSGAFVGRAFSKQWVTPDPSVKWHLLHGRPLPVPRRPDSTLSMKVVSG